MLTALFVSSERAGVGGSWLLQPQDLLHVVHGEFGAVRPARALPSGGDPLRGVFVRRSRSR